MSSTSSTSQANLQTISLEDTDVLSVVLYSVFSVLVLFSNSIVIIVIVKSRELHHPTLWNITVMAAWDFAFGLHTMVFIVPSKFLNAPAYPDSYGRIIGMLMSFIITQNLFSIMVALVDRYISVCRPLHYPRLMSAKRFIMAVIILFLINILRVFSLQSTVGVGTYSKALGFYFQDEPSLFSSVSAGLVVITAFIIVGLLIRTRLELGKRKTQVDTGSRPPTSTQFTYTMFVSTLVYIVCYIPAAFVVLISNVMNEESAVLQQIGFVCLLSNSLWNVFIYAVTYRPFRDAFLKLFCPIYFRQRARREIQVELRRNRETVFTVG